MTFDPLIHPWLYLAVIACLEGMAVYIWQYRDIPGVRSLLICLIARMFWVGSTLFINDNNDIALKLWGVKIYLVAAFIVAVSWSSLLLQLFEREKRLLKYRRFFLDVPFVLFPLLCLVDYEKTHLIIEGIRLEGPILHVMYAPLQKVILGYSYFLVSFAAMICARSGLKSSGQLRSQAVVMLAGTIFGSTGHIFWRFHSSPALRQVFLAISVLLVNTATALAVLRLRLFRARSTAQAVMVKNMGDGLIVLDSRDNIIDLTPSAEAITGTSISQAQGKPIEQALCDTPPVLRDIAAGGADSVREIDVDVYGTLKHYRIDRLPVLNHRHRLLGNVIVLHDITALRQEQAKTIAQEKALAILTERDRLGREIHDGQGQFPGYVKAQTQAVMMHLRLGRLDEAAAQLEQLAAAADTSYTDIRESIADLKTAVENWDFLDSIREQLRQFEKTHGIHTACTLPDALPESSLSVETEVQISRIIGEALANIRKHAQADNVRVELAIKDGKLIVAVADDGRGFEPRDATGPGRFGLRIMSERAAEFGGECRIESAPGAGTRVTVEAPLGGGLPG